MCVRDREMIAELGEAGGTSTNTAKSPPPSDPAKLRQAEQTMKERFQAEFEQATSLVKKAELAKRLIERGRTVSDDTELRFVMLREASDMAAAAGKPALACQAVDQIARLYSVDDLAMKVSTLEQAAKNVHGLQGYKEVVEQTLKVIEQSALVGRREEARRLLALAMSAAQKSRNVGLVRRVQALSQRIESLPQSRKADDRE